MKKLLTITAFILLLSNPTSTHAATTEFDQKETSASTTTELQDHYFRGTVISILEEGKKEVEPGVVQDYQKVEIEINDGDEKGKKIIIDHGALFAIEQSQKVVAGDKVVLVKPAGSAKQNFYYITDHYRLNSLLVIIVLFFFLAVLFTRKRGLTSVLGLLFSTAVIFYGIIPLILKGHSPLLISISGAMIILFFSLYLSHGFNKRTSIALLSSFITLVIAIVIDLLLVHFSHLSGNGTEEAFYLQFNGTPIDLKGLLLGGIIISVTGILDDVTTAQTASVEEIHNANRKLTFKELYRSGISIGQEHIASLINTLVLAYVGASFPLILLFATKNNLTLWMTLNSGFVSEEIVRVVVGSSALILAVPLSTLCASYFFAKQNIPSTKD
jgi:uncharacterized membrane protein